MGPGAEVSADSDTEKKHPVVGWTVKFQVYFRAKYAKIEKSIKLVDKVSKSR